MQNSVLPKSGLGGPSVYEKFGLPGPLTHTLQMVRLDL